MTVLPNLERQLTETAARRWSPQPAQHRQRRLRRGVPRRRAGVLVLIACLASGTAVAATQLWSPELGSDVAGRPTTSGSPVPPDQLAVLGVLRREQTDTDRGPEVQRTLRIMGSQLHGIRTSSVRALETLPHGLAVTLVSATRFGDEPPTTDAQLVNNPLCVLYPSQAVPPDATDSAGGSCYSTAEIRAGRARAESRGSDGAMHAHGLVPDHVRAVTARFGDGRTVTVEVYDNLFDIRLGSSTLAVGKERSADTSPVRYLWSDASGVDVTPAASDPG